MTVRRCRGFRWIDPTAGSRVYRHGSSSALVSCKCRLVGWFAGTFPRGLALPPWVLSFLSRLGVLGSDLGSKPELEDLRLIGLGHAAGVDILPISG